MCLSHTRQRCQGDGCDILVPHAYYGDACMCVSGRTACNHTSQAHDGICCVLQRLLPCGPLLGCAAANFGVLASVLPVCFPGVSAAFDDHLDNCWIYWSESRLGDFAREMSPSGYIFVKKIWRIACVWTNLIASSCFWYKNNQSLTINNCMIIFMQGADWERPSANLGQPSNYVSLTAAECNRVPVHTMTVSGGSMHARDRALDTITVVIPPTDLSDRLQGCTRLHFLRHVGMRTFAMGVHDRLGVGSPIRSLTGNEDVLLLIATFARGY